MSMARVLKRCIARFDGNIGFGTNERGSVQRNLFHLSDNPSMKLTWVDLRCLEIPAAAIMSVEFELIVRESSCCLKCGDLPCRCRLCRRRSQPTIFFSLVDVSHEKLQIDGAKKQQIYSSKGLSTSREVSRWRICSPTMLSAVLELVRRLVPEFNSRGHCLDSDDTNWKPTICVCIGSHRSLIHRCRFGKKQF